MWRKTLALAILLVVSGLCFADEEGPTPAEIDGLLCYEPAAHDELLMLWHADLDELDAAKDRIRILETDLAVARNEVVIAGMEARLERRRGDLLRLEAPGFWRRHFRLCGGVGGAVDVLGEDAGRGSLAVFGGLCVLP